MRTYDEQANDGIESTHFSSNEWHRFVVAATNYKLDISNRIHAIRAKTSTETTHNNMRLVDNNKDERQYTKLALNKIVMVMPSDEQRL